MAKDGLAMFNQCVYMCIWCPVERYVPSTLIKIKWTYLTIFLTPNNRVTFIPHSWGRLTSSSCQAFASIFTLLPTWSPLISVFIRILLLPAWSKSVNTWHYVWYPKILQTRAPIRAVLQTYHLWEFSILETFQCWKQLYFLQSTDIFFVSFFSKNIFTWNV